MSDDCSCATAACREDAMVVIERDGSGNPTVWCDPCIAPLVRALNDAGIATVASCCGHGEQPGIISLSDGRQLHISPPVHAEGCVWLHPLDRCSCGLVRAYAP